MKQEVKHELYVSELSSAVSEQEEEKHFNNWLFKCAIKLKPQFSQLFGSVDQSVVQSRHQQSA